MRGKGSWIVLDGCMTSGDGLPKRAEGWAVSGAGRGGSVSVGLLSLGGESRVQYDAALTSLMN